MGPSLSPREQSERLEQAHVQPGSVQRLSGCGKDQGTRASSVSQHRLLGPREDMPPFWQPLPAPGGIIAPPGAGAAPHCAGWEPGGTWPRSRLSPAGPAPLQPRAGNTFFLSLGCSVGLSAGKASPWLLITCQTPIPILTSIPTPIPAPCPNPRTHLGAPQHRRRSRSWGLHPPPPISNCFWGAAPTKLTHPQPPACPHPSSSLPSAGGSPEPPYAPRASSSRVRWRAMPTKHRGKLRQGHGGR